MFEFDYRLTGSGWAEARVADGEGHALVAASYLSDALRHLIEAVAFVVEGVGQSRCSFDEEPGEFRWLFRRTGDQVEVDVRAFNELWGDKPDEQGDVVFHTVQDTRHLGEVVLAAAPRLLDELGEREYERVWVQHPFPTDAVARLSAALT